MGIRFNVKLACKFQRELCEKKKHPQFAPKDGKCWGCGKNIYEPESKRTDGENGTVLYIYGISVEEARDKLIISCPHCNKSYCD